MYLVAFIPSISETGIGVSSKIGVIDEKGYFKLKPGKPNLVRVNGNWADPPLGFYQFSSGTEDWRVFLQLAHPTRLRQSGWIEKVRFAWATTKPDTIRFQIWRHVVGSKFAYVSSTENLAPSVVVNTINEITLANPIWGGLGDYYAVLVGNGHIGNDNKAIAAAFSDIPGDEPPGNESMPARGATNRKQAAIFWARATQSSYPKGLYNWGNNGTTGPFLSTEYIPVEFYMRAPQVVMLGASIITGHNEHRSFWENTQYDSIGTPGTAAFIANDTAATAMDSMPAYYICGTQVYDHVEGATEAWPWSFKKPDTDYTGWTFQNMGKSSDTATTLLNTFTQRFTNLHARAAFVGVGSADVNFTTAVTVHVAKIVELCDSFDSHLAHGFFRGIVPRTVWNPGDDVPTEIAKNDTVNMYNKAVAAAIRNHHETSANGTRMFYIPVYHRLGKDNPNAWSSTPQDDYHDLVTLYANTDTIHLNATGAKRMAIELLRRLKMPE
jgi:hypothetical protein